MRYPSYVVALAQEVQELNKVRPRLELLSVHSDVDASVSLTTIDFWPGCTQQVSSAKQEAMPIDESCLCLKSTRPGAIPPHWCRGTFYWFTGDGELRGEPCVSVTHNLHTCGARWCGWATEDGSCLCRCSPPPPEPEEAQADEEAEKRRWHISDRSRRGGARDTEAERQGGGACEDLELAHAGHGWQRRYGSDH